MCIFNDTYIILSLNMVSIVFLFSSDWREYAHVVFAHLW